MSRIESAAIDWIAKNAKVLFVVGTTLAGLLIRYLLRDVVSGDARVFLLPWHAEIAERGIADQVGDYGIPYQVVIYLLTLVPIEPLYGYKLVSVAFDVLLALEAALLVRDLSGNREKAVFAYAGVFLLPAVFLDSAAWAQCDSIYTFWIVASIRQMDRNRHVRALLLLGIAFAFKLQTVFMLPFFLFLYLLKREFGVLSFAAVGLGFLIPNVPGFVAGRSFGEPFSIFANQTGTWEAMYMNFPSFWVLVGDRYDVLKGVAIVVTASVLLAGLYFLVARFDRKGVEKGLLSERFDGIDSLRLAVWTSWTVVLFLPAMHERYGYPSMVLLFVLVVLDGRVAPVWVVAAVVELATYSAYLWGLDFSLLPAAVALVGCYAGFTAFVFRAWGVCAVDDR